MRIWIVQIGEMISGVDPAVRDYRYTTLSRHLAAAGHHVVRWSSTFEHISKKFRSDAAKTVEIAPRLQVRLLHALPAYRTNISVARWRQQREAARLFLAEAGSWPKPDVIVAGVPVPELAEAAVDFGREQGIPVVVDAQDQWPDIYLNAAPAPLRPLARVLLSAEFRRSQRVFARAAAITAVSQTYLEWAAARAGRSAGPADRVFPLGMTMPTARELRPEARHSVREKYGIRPGAMVALFVGTFGSSYDIETMVDCARRIEQAPPDVPVHLVIAGDGEKMLEARRAGKGCTALTLPGWLSHDAVAELMQVAEIGVCGYGANALQSIPYKPLEYMAASLPLISSLNGELEDIIEEWDCGRSYRAGDAASLEAELRWFSQHRLAAAEMGRRARQLFEARFDSQKIYAEFARHIEDLQQEFTHAR